MSKTPHWIRGWRRGGRAFTNKCPLSSMLRHFPQRYPHKASFGRRFLIRCTFGHNVAIFFTAPQAEIETPVVGAGRKAPALVFLHGGLESHQAVLPLVLPALESKCVAEGLTIMACRGSLVGAPLVFGGTAGSAGLLPAKPVETSQSIGL